MHFQDTCSGFVSFLFHLDRSNVVFTNTIVGHFGESFLPGFSPNPAHPVAARRGVGRQATARAVNRCAKLEGGSEE